MKNHSFQKVLLVRNNVGFGGAESYQITLAQELIKLRSPRVVIGANNQKLLDLARKAKLPAVKLPFLKLQNFSGWRYLLLPIYVLFQVRLFIVFIKVIKKYQIDILHIQSRDEMIAGTLAAKLLSKKVIWTDHTDFRWALQNVGRPFKNPIAKTIVALSKLNIKITTISHSEKRLIRKVAGANFANKVIVIPNGAQDKLAVFKSKTISKNSICFAGRIEKEKGINELITAFTRLKEDFPMARLEVLGDGSQRKVHKQSLTKNSHINFHGYLVDVLPTISQCEIFVLPSWREGMSLALLEAMMLGKTIIVSNISANTELIQNGVNGITFKTGDAGALETALRTLLSDASLLKQFGKAARRDFEKKYDFRKIVKERILPLYEN